MFNLQISLTVTKLYQNFLDLFSRNYRVIKAGFFKEDHLWRFKGHSKKKSLNAALWCSYWNQLCYLKFFSFFRTLKFFKFVNVWYLENLHKSKKFSCFKGCFNVSRVTLFQIKQTFSIFMDFSRGRH